MSSAICVAEQDATRRAKRGKPMLVYVAHEYGGNPRNLDRVRRITRLLALNNPEHTYICPLLNFSYYKYGEIGFHEELEKCIDLLSVCDVLLISSKISKGVQREIEFAELVGMEVVYLGE